MGEGLQKGLKTAASLPSPMSSCAVTSWEPPPNEHLSINLPLSTFSRIPKITCSWEWQKEIKARLPSFLVLESLNSSISITKDLNSSVLFCSVSCHGYLAKVIYTLKQPSHYAQRKKLWHKNCSRLMFCKSTGLFYTFSRTWKKSHRGLVFLWMNFLHYSWANAELF